MGFQQTPTGICTRHGSTACTFENAMHSASHFVFSSLTSCHSPSSSSVVRLFHSLLFCAELSMAWVGIGDVFYSSLSFIFYYGIIDFAQQAMGNDPHTPLAPFCTPNSKGNVWKDRVCDTPHHWKSIHAICIAIVLLCCSGSCPSAHYTSI